MAHSGRVRDSGSSGITQDQHHTYGVRAFQLDEVSPYEKPEDRQAGYRGEDDGRGSSCSRPKLENTLREAGTPDDQTQHERNQEERSCRPRAPPIEAAGVDLNPNKARNRNPERPHEAPRGRTLIHRPRCCLLGYALGHATVPRRTRRPNRDERKKERARGPTPVENMTVSPSARCDSGTGQSSVWAYGSIRPTTPTGHDGPGPS